MSDIYIVMGCTGEYSDRAEWPVKAFESKEKAQELILLADRRAKELAFEIKDLDWPKREQALQANTLDPSIMIDSDTGTKYFYITLKLER